MFSPIVFLYLAAIWVLVSLGFIVRELARLNREAKEDATLQEGPKRPPASPRSLEPN